MWTEIEKTLVSEEAIKEAGYEYEQTDTHYYVFEYLRYVCPKPITSTGNLLTPTPGGRRPPRRHNRRYQA